MTMIKIRKSNYDSSNYPCWIKNKDLNGKIHRPQFICRCGRYFDLSNYLITSDGIISDFNPRECFDEECYFNEDLQLLDYDCGRFSKKE